MQRCFLKITGYQREEVIGKDLLSIQADKQVQKEIKDLRTAIKTGRPARKILKSYRKDGSLFWCSLSKSPIFSKNNKAEYYIGVQEDVTDLIKTRNELEKSRKLLKSITDQTNAAIWVRDTKGRHLFANKEFKKLFNLEGQDVVGRSTTELFGEEIARLFSSNDQMVLSSGNPQIIEEQVQTANGLRDFKTNLFPLTNIAGYEHAVGGVATDITDQKEKEKELRLHSHLLNEISEAVIATDSEGNIIYWNSAAEDIYGWPSEETIGQNIYSLAPPDKLSDQEKRMLNSIGKGERWSGELEISRKGGTTFPAYITSSPFFDNQGQLQGAIGITIDITERKKLDDALRASLKEKETLLSEVHHRVKNNMAIITSMMQLQAYHESDANVAEKLLNSANRVKTMALIHEQLYDTESFSHLEFSSNLKKLVPTLVESFNYRELKLNTRFNCDVITLNINQAIPCALIVNEIITSILKHALIKKEQGEITISLSEANNQVTLCITDNGVELPQNIFEEGADKNLGLSIIRNLTLQLEGDYSYKPEAKGFHFSLTFDKADVKGAGSNLVLV